MSVDLNAWATAGTQSETADNYPAKAASHRWRIVRCRGDLQWILQRRRRAQLRARPWDAQAYILNDTALPAVLARRSLGIPAGDLSALRDQLGHVDG